MKISCIVLNWNGEKYISETLDSLSKIEVGNFDYELIVVDNDSSDNSIKLIENKFPKVKIIKSPVNLGYASGNNIGIKYALENGADYIFIVNSDITVDKKIVINFLDSVSKYPQAGICGAKIYFAPGFEFHKDRYSPKEIGNVIWYAGGIIDWKNVIASHRGVDIVDKGQFDNDLEVDFVTGAVMFIKRQVFEKIGLFDVKYAFYYEENDFCQRAKKVGYQLMYISNCMAWHANAQSTGMGSPLQDYFISRNRLMFGIKYAPLMSKQALIRESYRLLKNGREWQKKGISDYYSRNLGFGSYPIK